MGRTRRGEIIGYILLGLMLPGLEKLSEAQDRWEQTQRNLQLAFILALYRHDHGRYPADWKDLVPKYLDKTPIDIFTGEPLTYRLDGEDGYVFYSFGVNGVDDDGQGYGEDPKGDDLTIRMVVPEPPARK